MLGKYYVDYDKNTGFWCVFHTENQKATANYINKEDAEKRAKSLNEETL